LWFRPLHRVHDEAYLRGPSLKSDGWEVEVEFEGSLTLWDDKAVLLHSPISHPAISDESWGDDGQAVTLWAPESHPVSLGEGWETDEDGVTLWDPHGHPVSFDAEWESDGLAVTLWD